MNHTAAFAARNNGIPARMHGHEPWKASRLASHARTEQQSYNGDNAIVLSNSLIMAIMQLYYLFYFKRWLCCLRDTLQAFGGFVAHVVAAIDQAVKAMCLLQKQRKWSLFSKNIGLP